MSHEVLTTIENHEYQPQALFSAREVLESQDAATLHAYIAALYEKENDIEEEIRQVKDVLEAITGEEYHV